jgi:hypothetical protein
MRKYPLIAAAVTAALGSVQAFAAGPPTLAQAAAAQVKFYVAGSSAAQKAFGVAVASDLCGGTANLLTVSSTNSSGLTIGNFKTYSCVAAANTAIGGSIANGTNVWTFYYRAEGGSVTGALPIAHGANLKLKQLDLTNTANCTASGVTGTCTVTGTPSAVGTTDGWTGAVTTHTIELGITDVEPGALIGDNYPSGYSASVFGSASPTDLANLNGDPGFVQVFGIFVNTHAAGLGNVTALNLTKEAVTNILNGNYGDWSSVPDANGNPVSTTGSPITIVNREAGSGSRTSASIYFLEDNCASSGVTMFDPGGTTGDLYSTGDELTAANATGGAIAYASIDNNGSKPNLVLVSIDGVQPSQLAAAGGQYDYWVESGFVQNSVAYDANGANVDAWLEPELGHYTTAAPALQVLAIPSKQGNPSGTVPLTSNAHGGVTIYLNPYTRGGNSCSLPGETN